MTWLELLERAAPGARGARGVPGVDAASRLTQSAPRFRCSQGALPHRGCAYSVSGRLLSTCCMPGPRRALWQRDEWDPRRPVQITAVLFLSRGRGGGGAKSPGPHSVLCEPFLTLVYIVTYLLQPPAPESSRSGWVEGPTCQPAAGEPRRPQATTQCPRGAAGGRCSEGRPAGSTDGQEVPSASKK